MKKCITGLMVLFAAQYANATIHNVPGDYPDIQTCINFAANGDECLVAPGTYNETINFIGKAITLRSSGGADVTTIDATGLNDSVVKCVSGEGQDTVLDGFTITGGNAVSGGGMYNQDSSPTITNCMFSGNLAFTSGGGGMRNASSSPAVTNCLFIGNTANSGSGGGSGGGMFNSSSSSPAVTECIFIGNVAAAGGGGMYNLFDCNPNVTNCTFLGNSAVNQGGGGINNDRSSPIVTNCTFSGNAADNGGGGGMFNETGSPTLTNCTFSRNSARVNGCGSSGCGGGVWSQSGGNMVVNNCILWENTPNQIASSVTNLTIRFSNIQSFSKGEGNISINPWFLDPDGADDILGTEDDDLRLSPCSPSIDTGDNDSVPPDIADLDGDGDTTEPIPFDFDGLPRIVGDVDMGAYEFQESPVLLSNPPNCSIDARQPHDPLNPNVRFGLTEITFSFSCSPGSFSVAVEEGTPPVIIDVIESEDTFTLVLDEPIPAGQWTCFTLDATDAQVCLGYLPGDVNGDGVSAPSDILAVIDSLNGVAPLPEYATDANRSGVSGPEDILRVIDLLNGAAAFEPWLDAMLSECPSN